MQIFDHKMDHPQAHLDLDERLLDIAEAKGHAFLRFWESPSYFVVLGRSNVAEAEVNLAACTKDQIPVLRRCSGGGTVLQGPGCLNYALVFPIDFAPQLATISDTTQWIMAQNAQAIRTQLPSIQVQGISDLTFNGLKFSGNAQRRKRNAVLFHGTFLLNFDLDKISQYLAMPTKQPEYRQNRPHREFCTNLPITPSQVKAALEFWAKIQ